MRWIGGHPEGSEIPQLAEGVKQGITPFVQGAGQGAGEMAGRGSQDIGRGAGSVGQSVGSGAADFDKRKEQNENNKVRLQGKDPE